MAKHFRYSLNYSFKTTWHFVGPKVLLHHRQIGYTWYVSIVGELLPGYKAVLMKVARVNHLTNRIVRHLLMGCVREVSCSNT